MMELAFISDFFEYEFLSRALIAGVLMSVTCGFLAPFVVLRRLSFSADGLAHASLGGLALGMFLLTAGPAPTWSSYLISFVFTGIVAAGIAYFSDGQLIHSDTATGACYVAAFALGILLLSLRDRYTGHLESFFFGSMLAVNPLECWLLGGLAFLTAFLCFSTWSWLGKWTFDEELAQASGVPTERLRYVLMMLVAAAVIVSSRVVGLLLITSMLTLPGAVGTLLGRTMKTVVGLSLGSAFTITVVGLTVSNTVDLPPGPVIVLLGFLLFVTAYLLRHGQAQHLSRG